MKRFLSTLLALCLVIGMFPAVSAAGNIASGSCGENLTWVLTDDGALTISGEGDMDDFANNDYQAPWSGYRSSILSVVVEDGVTSITSLAFAGCRALSRVDLPDQITEISSNLFLQCFSLTEIVIPDSVTTIGEYAFQGCTALAKIELPDSLTEIGRYAFSLCPSLTHMDLPDHITEIAEGLFWSDTALTEITIPDGVTTIGRMAFSGCSALTKAVIPSSVTAIDASAFRDCSEALEIHGYTGSYAETYAAERGITFVALDAHTHSYEAVITAPTCTEKGFTTYTCACGDSYVEDYVDALGHDYVDDICTRCGAAMDNPFTDVQPGAFYEEPVLWAVKNGITTGATADTFNPNGTCLRAQVVTFLHRAAGNPIPADSSNPFADVKSSDFFYAPVLWAVEKGITNGVSATEFGSYANCNRAAVVTFLWRAAGSPEPESTENPFTDVKNTDFFYKSVLWAIENGITNGLSATEFGPTANCNRAQVVTFLHRAYT